MSFEVYHLSLTAKPGRRTSTYNLLVTIAFTLASFATVNAQYDARVLTASSETGDSIAFQISAEKKVYRSDEDISVNYTVKNNSGKTVYLITGPSSQLSIKDSLVEILQPVKTPNAHERYDYHFIEILPGRSYKGKLLIEIKKLAAGSKYNWELVTIQASFSYLLDVSGLKGCEDAEYTLPCLSQVDKESKTLTLGNLVVERKLE